VSAWPRVDRSGTNGTQFSFGFATVVGLTYQVEYSDTLAPESWVALGGPIAGTGDVVSITTDIDCRPTDSIVSE